MHMTAKMDKRENAFGLLELFSKELLAILELTAPVDRGKSYAFGGVVEQESSFAELGNVDLVLVKLPKKLKKRRHVETEDGPAGYDE